MGDSLTTARTRALRSARTVEARGLVGTRVLLVNPSAPLAAAVIEVEGEWVYGLVDPLAPELIRYVGRTRKPLRRYVEHWTTLGGERADKTAWKSSMRAAGRSPCMVGLEYLADEDDARACERAWITRCRAAGMADLNGPATFRGFPRRTDDASEDTNV